MNIFKRKCDSCGKKLGLFEKIHRWTSGSGSQLKYCKDCHKKGIGANEPIRKVTSSIERPIIRVERAYQKSVKKKQKSFKGKCEYCKNKIGGLDVFYCKYCGKYHCPKHRIPENHECKGKVGKPGELSKGSVISYSSRK